MNELLWLLFALASLGLVLLVFRLYGREGLMAFIAAAIILCNLQVIKLTTLFGITVTLGNILYGAIFFCTDLLNELYGPRTARRGVMLGFIVMIFFTLSSQLALVFSVAPDPWAEQVQGAMETIYGFMPRLAVASLAAYLLSQLHDVWAFAWWRRKTRGRMLWLRNNLSTAVSQLIDSAVFCFIAFAGVVEREHFLQILVTTYVIKVLVALLDTPFLYMGRAIARRRGEAPAADQVVMQP
ncbi:MAG: queuosine precursor transporter [Candidatus Fermentibacteraceae bacterium]